MLLCNFALYPPSEKRRRTKTVGAAILILNRRMLKTHYQCCKLKKWRKMSIKGMFDFGVIIPTIFGSPITLGI